MLGQATLLSSALVHYCDNHPRAVDVLHRRMLVWTNLISREPLSLPFRFHPRLRANHIHIYDRAALDYIFFSTATKF
jgi:hypothetical protein